MNETKTYAAEVQEMGSPITLTYYTLATTMTEAYVKFVAIPNVERIVEVAEKRWARII